MEKVRCKIRGGVYNETLCGGGCSARPFERRTMLTISKPTVFSPDGLAARGQCSKDSPGWQLRWFDPRTPPVLVWQGAYKTCRHLQAGCADATDMEQVKRTVEELLSASSFAHFASQPTDVFPTPTRAEKALREQDGTGAKKKRKKKRH